MNPLAIPTAHGHIALAVWATPRVAASPEGAASARKAQKAEGRALARSGGCVVLNPAFTLRCTFAPKRARASRPGRDVTASTVTSIRPVARRRTGCRAQSWSEHQQHHRHHSKQELCDGIRRKQARIRHATALPEDDKRHCRGGRLGASALGAVRLDCPCSNQDVESAAVESLRSPVRYLVRWLREGVGKKERHHRHCRSHSAPRGAGTRRSGGCGRSRTRPDHVQRLWWAAPV